LLPNTVLTEKPQQFSPQRQAKHIKAFQNKAVRGEILNKNTKQAAFTDSVTKVCGSLLPLDSESSRPPGMTTFTEVFRNFAYT